MLILIPIIKFIIAISLILFLLMVALTVIGIGIRYFYSKRITGLGNWFVQLGIANRPMELYELLTSDAKKTTSFQEVVFLCCRMHIFLAPGTKAVWGRTQRIGREGLLEGALVGKDGRRHILTLHLRRKHQKWKVLSITLTENYSRAIILE